MSQADGSAGNTGAAQAPRAEARLREAATREILSVISRSRDDEQPVFDVILENAARLCHAPFACFFRANPERTHLTIPAFVGTRTEFVDLINADPLPLDPEQALTARAMVEKSTLQVADFREDPIYRAGQRHRVHAVEVEGIRTVLAVPLLGGDDAIGVIVLYRREVALFSDDEVRLVETFAAQAVIAIENVRQFRKLQSRLEREKASREILGVISRSRDDEQPVFDVILRNAARLCHTTMARLHILEPDRRRRRLAAHWGEELRTLKIGETMPMDGGHPISLTIREARTIHIEDLAETDLYRGGDPLFTRLVEEEGLRTLLTVPLMGGGDAFGCIALSRRERKAFTDDDIRLVETFAAQAVIAIENVRQFRELQTRLERETATREILGVISQSRDDEQPVFEAIIENARRLCEARMGAFVMGEEGGGPQVLVAHRGATEESIRIYGEGRFPMDPEVSTAARAIITGKTIHLHDMADTDAYRAGHPNFVSLVDEQGVRTNLLVPLVAQGRGIGCLILFRDEVRPYSDDEIALVETFAAQAVIAIENVRQFRALEALNAELGARVEKQVGEIERMGRLKRFLSPAVAETVVSTGSEKLLQSHRALIAVLFCDIRGFTAFCETAEPEETIEVLQTYHEEMGRLIAGHGAGVDHRSGDGIMAIFNDPLPCDDPAGDALRMALAMRTRMAELSQDWRRLGHRLGFGVGISLGYATVGMVGSEGRYDYTASGTAVNLAARLCNEADDGDILLSPRAMAAVGDDFAAESRGEISLKGIHAPVEVFRVTGPHEGKGQ